MQELPKSVVISNIYPEYWASSPRSLFIKSELAKLGVKEDPVDIVIDGDINTLTVRLRVFFCELSEHLKDVFISGGCTVANIGELYNPEGTTHG